MQLTEMRSRLRRQVGNPTTTDVADSVLTQHINSGYKEIANKFRFHTVRKLCRFSTVVGTKRYGIPSDCAVVLRVRDLTNEKRLEKFDDRRAFEEVDLDTTGYPTYYTRFRDWVELHPSPNGVYEIELHYKADMADLAGDTETPTLPTSWHEGILRLAKYYYYDEQGDIPKATAAYNAYTVWADSKPIEVDEEKTDFDSGVTVPTLSNGLPKNLDFNHSE